MKRERLLTGIGILLEALHRPQAAAGDERNGHPLEGVPAIKAAMCGNGPCKKVACIPPGIV